MADVKTRENDADVEAFLASVDNLRRAADARAVAAMMAEVTGEPPRMWGKNIVGFGRYHYRYASGREGDWFWCGLSPRKQALSVYIMPGFSGFDELLGRLGKHRTGKSCLYINRLEDVDTEVLEELIRASVAKIRENWPDA